MLYVLKTAVTKVAAIVKLRFITKQFIPSKDKCKVMRELLLQSNV